MAKKYYEALNSNRTIVAGGYSFNFEAVRLFAGTWLGVYATEDAGEQSALDALAREPKSAVTALTAEDYAGRLGQKTGVDNYAPNPNVIVAPAPGPARLATKPGVLIEEP